jgi:hypothetical protein
MDDENTDLCLTFSEHSAKFLSATVRLQSGQEDTFPATETFETGSTLCVTYYVKLH